MTKDLERRLARMAGESPSVEERLDAMLRSGAETDAPSSPKYLPGKKSKSGGSAVSRLPDSKRTERAVPEIKNNFDLRKALTTPAKSGYFEGASFLPDSPQSFARGLGYHAERAGAGILGGIEGITDFVGSSAAGIASDLTSLGGQFNNPVSDWLRNQSEDFLHTSPTQTWKNSINERYQPSVGDQRLGSVTENVAQMLLPMGAGKVVSAISVGSSALNAANAASKGAAASKALFGLQAAGQGAQEAAMEGASTGRALTYGTLSGLLETSIESLAGGIPGLGKGVLSDVARKVASHPVVARTLDIVGEGGEEALSTIITPYIQRAVYDVDAKNATAGEIAESAVMGMVTAGILQAGIELPGTVSQVMDIRQSIGTNQDIVSRVNQRLSQPGQVMADLMNAGAARPTVDTKSNGPYDGTTQRQSAPSAEVSRAAENRDAADPLSRLSGESGSTDAPAQSRWARTDAEVTYNMEQMRRAADESGFGKNGKKALTASYDGTTEGGAYYAGFAAYYNAGVSGRDMGKVHSIYAQDLSEAQRYTAYYAGQNDAAASLAAEREGVQSAAVHGNEAVLVDNDLAKLLPARTAALYNTLAKAAGVKIELVEQVLTPDGKDGGNGLYDKESGTIRISINADGVKDGNGGLNVSALNAVAAHEITHRIQNLAPEEYRQYRDYAMNALSEEGSADDLVELYKARYAESWVELNTEQAMDEIAADFTRNMLEDAELFRGLAQENRSLARRVMDALRNFIRKVKSAFSSQSARNREAMDEYGVSMDTLEKAAGLWQSAYDAAAREVLQRTAANAGAKKNAVRTDGEVKLSLKTVNGKQIVWIENSSLTNKELNNHKAVAEFIARHIGEVYTIIESGQKVYIGKDLPGEYTQSKYTSYLRSTDRAAFRAKRKVVDGLGELIETATNRRWERTRHTQSKDAKYGMYRYDSTFAFPVKDGGGAVQWVRAYDAELLIRNASDGKKYLYDIVNIKENTAAQSDLTEREARSAAHKTATGRGVSDTSIDEAGGDVNGRFSLKNPVEYTQASSLQTQRADATMGNTRYSMKEEQDRGEAREETRESFLRRAAGEGYAIFEGKTAAYGYRRPVQGEHSEGRSARQVQEEIKSLGIEAEIIDGPVLWNQNGITRVRSVPEACTVENARILIGKDTTISPRNTAGHEAFHLWENGTGRDDYVEVLTDHLLFSSKEFIEYQKEVSKAYFGKEVELSDEKEINALREEVFAYISGDIHEGTNDDLLRPMFRDYDAVKAAWEALVRENSRARFSLKGTGQLQRQVQNLEERNRYLQEQLKRTKGIKTDRKKTTSFARNLLTAYESQYDRDTLTGELLDIYDEIANSRDGVDMDGLRTKAREVAERVLEQSVRVDAEVYNEYSSLRNYLRTTRIKVPKSIHADLEPVGGYNGIRRGNSRRLKLSTTEGMDIDTLYRELSQQYPGLFDEQAYTNPADQLINISDVLDSIQPVVSNPYSSDMEMAARFVANEILEGYFDVPQQRPTFADRQDARVEAARAAGNRRLTEQRERGRQKAEELRQRNRDTVLAERMAAGRENAAMRRRYDQRIAQLRQQGREQVQSAISRERKRRADQVQAIKEKYTSRDIAARERRNARELRNRIQRHVQALSTRLLNPTDSRNVPEALRRPVAALLAAINQESAYTLDPDTLHEVIRKDGKSGGITGKRLSHDDGRGAATKRTEAFRKLREQYLKIAGENGDMVIDPALFGDAAEGIEGGFDTVIAMEDIPLAAMNTEQLTAVWKVVKAVEHSVSTAGKTLSETKYEATKDWALALERDTASRKNRRTLTENGVLKSLENPYTFFSHYGEAGHAVYRMLRNAQDRQQLMQRQVEQEVRNIADPKTVKRLEETVHTFTTERGDRLTLSTAQVMELYELMKREQAHNHLLKGGIVQPAIRSKKIRRGTDAILLSGEDLGSIVKVLSDEEITIADALQKLTAGLLADYGNEASMAVYGYKKFTGTGYWPIQTAKEGIHATVEKGANNTRSIKNIGLAKATVPHASNALDLPGIFETFATHSADMVDYAAWLAPMEDANRLFNYKYRDENGSPTNRTVKGLLERVGGSGAQNYWHNLMVNIQNGIAVPGDDPMTRLVSKGIGSFKGAAVGGNVRVVIQQPTAFFRAGVVLSPADLTKGLVKGVTSGSGWQKALQYSPIAMRKAAGSFDISNPATMKEALFDGRSRVRKFNDALSAPAGMADAVTWGRLWNACEWATAREHKGLRAGSEAFYRKVNELFTEVIDQTQVVDGVLQRSNIMRSRNTLAQQATSFMGEPIMSLNIFLRAYDQMRYEQDAGKRGKAKKRLGRAVTALLVTNVVNALAQSLVDAMRDDDEDKKYWERFRSAFTGLTGEEESAWDKAVAVVLNGNAGSALNVAGQIPYVRDVLSLAQGYDVARTDMEIFTDLVRAAQTLMQSAGGNGPRTRAYAVKELISAGAKVFGTPVGNLARDIFGFARSVAVQTDNIPLQFEMEKAVYNITNEKNKGRYYDILFRALRQNDMDSYFRMQRELMEEMGVDGEQIAGAMRERLKKAGEEDPGLQLSQEVYDLLGLYEQHAPPKPSPERFGPDDLEAGAYRAYSQQSAADFRALHDKLKTMDAFAALPDEEKDNALDAARALAESAALRDHSGGQYTDGDFSLWERWAEMGEGYGVDETEAILFRIAYDMTEGDPDEKGNTVSGSKKENVLEAVDELMPWLTDAELEYLKTLYWTPEDKALKALKENKFMPG